MAKTRSTREELALAEELDLRGDHDNAINALARATQAGDIEAKTRLAKRLITGKNAPCLPTDGARFLVEAANAGGPEAAAKLAVLATTGMFVRQSTEAAVQLLVMSAERGWKSAQHQLLALSPDRELADSIDKNRSAAADWKRIGSTIDPQDWAQAPQGRTVNASPRIESFERLIPASVCRWIIENSVGRLERALVYDAVDEAQFESDTRTNSWAQFDLMDCDVIQPLIQLRMQAACGIPLAHMEANTILHYATGEESTNHFDFVDPGIANYEEEIAKNGQRVLTFLVYLNEDYSGGETDFPLLGISHKGRTGEGLYFINALDDGSPDKRTLHAGRPPTSGEKWIVSQFIRNRRLLGAQAP